MTQRTFWNLFKYVLAFGLLGWVVWSNWQPGSDQGLEFIWNKHVQQGQPVQYQFLLLATALMLVSLMLTLVRWFVLVRAVGLPFRFIDALRLGFVGFFFNTFLPGSVGGDIIKAAFLAGEHRRRTVAVATVIMDRAIALWALIWFVAMVGGIFWFAGLLDGKAAEVSQSIIMITATIVVVTAAIWLLLGLLPDRRAERFAKRLNHLPGVGRAAAEFWRAVWMYRCQQSTVALAMLITWVGQIGFVICFYCCVRTLWDPSDNLPIPSLAQHFLIVPIGLVIQAIPLFPGGAGIGEAGYGGLYSLFGCAVAVGVLGSLVYRVLTWIIGFFCYFIYLRMKHQLADPSALSNGADAHSLAQV